MPTDDLVQLIEPFHLASLGQRLKGRVAIAKMTRLLPSLLEDRGYADVELQFGIDSAGQAFVKGYVNAELSLLCNRCMEKMTMPIQADFNLGIVHSYVQAERLPAEYEPLVIQESQIKTLDIVEDELLLALPIIVKHPDSVNCVGNMDASAYVHKKNHVLPEKQEDVNKVETADSTKQNPFLVLEKLKSK